MVNNNKSPMRNFVKQGLKILRGILDVFFHWLFGLVYGVKGKTMPPISDLLLLESASSIAYKIRTGKVRFLVLIINKIHFIL